MQLSQLISEATSSLASSELIALTKESATINDLLSLQEFADIISNANPENLNLRFACAKNRYIKYFTEWRIRSPNKNGRQEIDCESMENLLKLGATLILDDVQDVSAPVKILLTKMESLLPCTIRASAYYSLQDATSFGMHFDSHDVLAIQLHGRKSWKIHKPTHDSPQKGSKHLPFIRPSTTQFSVIEPREMQPMFVPLGYWHETFTNSASSLHLSLILNYPRVIDVVLHQFEQLKDEPIFRRQVRAPLSRTQESQIIDRLTAFSQEISLVVSKKTKKLMKFI